MHLLQEDILLLVHEFGCKHNLIIDIELTRVAVRSSCFQLNVFCQNDFNLNSNILHSESNVCARIVKRPCTLYVVTQREGIYIYA